MSTSDKVFDPRSTVCKPVPAGCGEFINTIGKLPAPLVVSTSSGDMTYKPVGNALLPTAIKIICETKTLKTLLKPLVDIMRLDFSSASNKLTTEYKIANIPNTQDELVKWYSKQISTFLSPENVMCVVNESTSVLNSALVMLNKKGPSSPIYTTLPVFNETSTSAADAGLRVFCREFVSAHNAQWPSSIRDKFTGDVLAVYAIVSATVFLPYKFSPVPATGKVDNMLTAIKLQRILAHVFDVLNMTGQTVNKHFTVPQSSQQNAASRTNGPSVSTKSKPVVSKQTGDAKLPESVKQSKPDTAETVGKDETRTDAVADPTSGKIAVEDAETAAEEDSAENQNGNSVHDVAVSQHEQPNTDIQSVVDTDAIGESFRAEKADAIKGTVHDIAPIQDDQEEAGQPVVDDEDGKVADPHPMDTNDEVFSVQNENAEQEDREENQDKTGAVQNMETDYGDDPRSNVHNDDATNERSRGEKRVRIYDDESSDSSISDNSSCVTDHVNGDYNAGINKSSTSMNKKPTKLPPMTEEERKNHKNLMARIRNAKKRALLKAKESYNNTQHTVTANLSKSKQPEKKVTVDIKALDAKPYTTTAQQVTEGLSNCIGVHPMQVALKAVVPQITSSTSMSADTLVTILAKTKPGILDIRLFVALCAQHIDGDVTQASIVARVVQQLDDPGAASFSISPESLTHVANAHRILHSLPIDAPVYMNYSFETVAMLPTLALVILNVYPDMFIPGANRTKFRIHQEYESVSWASKHK